MIVHPEKASLSELYRLLLRTVLPRPIAWISTVSGEGVLNLAPFSFFTAVTSKPPTICFSPTRRPDGSKKDTLQNIEQTGEFVVNVVTEDVAQQMNETATDFPSDIDEFESAGLTPVPSQIVTPPRVKESPIHMECKLYKFVPVGERGGGLVIGEVVIFHIADDVLEDGKVAPGLLKPVGRLGGIDYAKTTDRFSMPRKKYRPKTP